MRRFCSGCHGYQLSQSTTYQQMKAASEVVLRQSLKMDLFAERLTVALQEKFEGHWVPERPSKGQAYRCIRVNAFHKYDPELLRACRESGVHYGDLGLPWEITLWVDPGEVCGRGAHIPPPSPSPTGSAR
uniref:B-cell translocation gene 3 n=1 Tax=Gouania willdenowi TaxID=441366 RepID=A0A8C5DH09_GOUWI